MIIWFRPELEQEILWSGNPNLSKEKDIHGNLHRRKSFETWKESVVGRSVNWKPSEIDASLYLLEGLNNIPRLSQKDLHDANESKSFRKALAQSMETTLKSYSLNTNPVTSISSEDEDKALMDGFYDFAVAFLDANGKIKRWSKGAPNLLGYENEEVLNGTLDFLFSEDEAAKDKHMRILNFVQ